MEITKDAQQVSRLKHPPGLYLLFLTEMWERFSYYGLRALLMLYLTTSFIQGGLGFSVSTAALIYGTYTGFTYFTPIIGGYLADNYLGQKKSVIIGGGIMFLGNLTLFLVGNRVGLFAGLALLIIGNGFFKPNISTIVGQLYKPEDKRKDSAFTIFYMGINLGSFIAPLICGYFAENLFASTVNGQIAYGFKYGFLAAAIGMVIGEVIYIVFSPKYLGHLGEEPAAKKIDKNSNKSYKNEPLTKEEKKKVKLAQKEIRIKKTRLREVESSIAENEALLEKLNNDLCLEEIYSNPKEAERVNKEISNTEITIESLYEEWESLSEELNS